MPAFKFKSSIIIIISLFAMVLGVMAQKPLSQQFIDSAGLSKSGSDICGTDIMLSQLRRNPTYRTLEDQMNREIMRALNILTDDTLTLPVVIHIINQNPYTITDAQVINGINLLNDAFSKSGAYAASAGVDTKLRFCIAKKDPEGGITTGITRTTSFFSNSLNKDIEDGKLKNLIQWDPKKYINIWLITSIEAEAYANFSCGAWYRLRTGGYATLPPGGGVLDGIVITGFGHILAHEMGHYLGLYHTFEGGCTNNNCLTDGDKVCDTPPDRSVKPSCSSPENSCSTDTLSNYSNGIFPADVPDQVSNFMDYGNSSCSNQFTQGQADRMRAAITTQRPGLLEDECQPPCIENIVASFTRDIAYSVVGNTLNFTNTSTGATSFEWLVNDSVISTSLNFSHIFNSVAKDKMTLRAFNTPGCFASYTSYVLTGCGVTARFYSDKQVIASKAGIYSDSIYFTNTSSNGLTYQWLLSNNKGMAEQVISTGFDFKYVFPSPANYLLRLIATNGSCSDTTDYYSIPVLDPTADGSVFASSFYCYGSNKVNVSFCIANYGYAPIPKGTPVSFYEADPRNPGAKKLSSTMYLPSAVPGGNCYICYNHVLAVHYKGLEKIYISINDSGLVAPLVFPNTNLVEGNYSNNVNTAQTLRTTINLTICDGSSYAGYKIAGTYIDTLVSKLNGCDSIRTLYLKVNPVYKTTVTTSICDGQNYGGHTASGTYVDHFKSANGCDSTRTLHLTVKPNRSTTINAVICEGYDFEGYTKSGNYIDHFTAANGCDSSRTLHLTVKPKSNTIINGSICEGESFFTDGGPKVSSGIYIDTLINYLGCDSIITTHLQVNPLPKPDLGVDRGICIGDTLQLNPGTFATYLWQDGSTNSTFSTIKLGHYAVKVTTQYGCIASAQMNAIRIDPLPKNFLRTDTSLCRGNTVVLEAPGFITYSWNTGENNASINVTKNGLYQLNVIDKNGCKGLDSVKILFYDCQDVWIPNAFTPDKNGLNEIFRPVFPAPVKNYRLQIWNRSGLRIFESSNTALGWNGKFKGIDQRVDIYVYVLSFVDIDGNNVLKKGTISLLK